MAPIMEFTSDELMEKQSELLARLGLTSYAEFAEKAAEGRLSDLDWEMRDELDSLNFLLGGSTTHA